MIPPKTATGSSADDQQTASASSNHINVEEVRVEPATRESTPAATGAPPPTTTQHAVLQRPEEMETERKQRSGKKQKTRKDVTSDQSTNQLTAPNVVNTESGTFIQCAHIFGFMIESIKY